MNNELAKRAVACKGWRWMEGMACQWEQLKGAAGQQLLPTWARVVNMPQGPLSLAFCLVDVQSVYPIALPDLDDPATIGCLLALVREAYGSEWVHAEAHEFDDEHHNFWCVWAGTRSFEADTEVEALVRALEASP